MPTRQFNADLAAAAARSAAGDFAGVVSVAKGDSDGEVVISYHSEELGGLHTVRLVCPDTTEYPKDSSFLVFTDTEGTPDALLAAMETLQVLSAGCDINKVVAIVSKMLVKASSGSAISSESDGSDDQEMTDVGDESEGDDDDDDEYEYDDAIFGLSSSVAEPLNGPPAASEAAIGRCERLKSDLLKARDAGYKIGVLCGFEPAADRTIVSLSIRATKLGLSESTLRSWNIRSNDYIVLLISVDGPYQPLMEFLQYPTAGGHSIQFRIGRCGRFKPTELDALAAFAPSGKQTVWSELQAAKSPEAAHKFSRTIVSTSLDQFMAHRFLSIVNFRESAGVSWDAANRLAIAQRGKGKGKLAMDTTSDPGEDDGSESGSESDKSGESGESGESGDRDESDSSTLDLIPDVLRQDHLSEEIDPRDRSLPLVAMQFAMHYFAGCNKYCMRCYRGIGKEFEALRPFVCSDPLCLFQYMTMGFGPCIENEIVSQPMVVDLLVSFCYYALRPPSNPRVARGGYGPMSSIRELPLGLHLKVLDLRNRTITGYATASGSKFELDRAEDANQLTCGQWVAIVSTQEEAETQPASRRRLSESLYHGRIRSIDYTTKTIELECVGVSFLEPSRWTSEDSNQPGSTPGIDPAAASATPSLQTGFDGQLLVYEADFGSLSDEHKLGAMRYILDTLPPIAELKKCLETTHQSLRLIPTVSPAAASILEWIVASNRSCIVQAGTDDTGEDDKVTGMKGWMQFRFTQGSPDKELRFNRALQEVQARRGLQYPTMFAFHGSSLPNWHSIVRTGLDYRQTHNGRSYGNGVYFSKEFKTSVGYAGSRSALNSGWQSSGWQNSELKINSAVSLNEIINAPDEFISQNPHYVVAQPDWHQCRYLFVQCTDSRNCEPSMEGSESSEASSYGKDPSKWLIQDPLRLIRGPAPENEIVHIPRAAMPSTRCRNSGATDASSSRAAAGYTDDDEEEEEVDDIDRLVPEDAARTTALSRRSSSSVDTLAPAQTQTQMLVTEFVPGALDLETLPLMQPPSWATSTSVQSISREVRKLQAVQTRTPLPELGWYIDFDKMDNVFQWIVELHSFDLSLPLAQDMKIQGVTSVVCEIRFGPQFPITPPFVRVVRPRFLPFARGGGGHVTAGGAMCMELLTNTGWSPANSIEAVLLQVRLAMCSLDPVPARLDPNPRDYGLGEAVQAYIRAAQNHGWTVPDDIHTTSGTG